MKRVLVLAYFFPPLGGAGVQRTVKFVKHLRELGYRSTVVTGTEHATFDWAPPDPALAAEVPADVQVLRAASPQPPSAPSSQRLRRWLHLTSAFEAWWQREAIAVSRPVLGDVDIVYASMSPFGTAAVAAELARVAGVPWIADLRDPWALDEWSVYPSGLHRRLEERTMRRDLGTAAALVMNTEEARNVLLRAFPEFASSRIATIPNGWDKEDFRDPFPGRDDDRFRIVYTGYTHAAAGLRHRRRAPLRTVLGGSVRGMDILPRSEIFLLEAVRRLFDLDPELAERVEVHIAGAAADASVDEAAGVPVHRHGYLSHRAAVELMCSADALFLPMHDLPQGMRSRTVPGKTYEYLASMRPIVGALPDGDARDLLARLPNARLCRPSDVDGIAAAISEIAALPDVPTPRRELLDLYERRHLAEQLASLFDEVLAAQTATS